MFGSSPFDPKSKLYTPNIDWQPEPAPPELALRLKNFGKKITSLFSKRKKQPTNLLPTQRAAFRWLMNHPNIVVCASDKNLGPVVMEREKYLCLTFRDHLSDGNTYKRLEKPYALARLKEVFRDIDSFGNKFQSLPSDEVKYIRRKLDTVNQCNITSFLYANPKIHKTPLKTRPIISYCGSLCEGLAKWVDNELKKIVKHLPFVAIDSKGIKEDLLNIQAQENATIFTHDAVSMYTNIHVGHALPVIANFLASHELGQKIKRCEKIHVGALLFAINLIMKNNIFMFGDTYWIQLAGTAMGTPPAPPIRHTLLRHPRTRNCKKIPRNWILQPIHRRWYRHMDPPNERCRHRSKKIQSVPKRDQLLWNQPSVLQRQ